MSKQPKRIIEHALLEGIGPISAERLLGLPETEWGLLRSAITDARRAQPPRHIARCLMCSGAIFIQARAFRGLRLPYFAHFKGGDATCPWHTGETLHPDDARALQYGGAQESAAHRMLCEQIAELAARDDRCISAEVSKYLTPTDNERGRYPDVLILRRNAPKIAVEIQLSNTFQTEVSARCLHYEREGVGLLWVLYGLDMRAHDLPQSFRDVVLRHRGNAFLLDDEAVAESLSRRTLVLKCYLRGPDGSFDAGRLVTLDDLTFPTRGPPYLEDRITPGLLARGEAARAPWRAALRGRSSDFSYADLRGPAFLAANDHLCGSVPSLRQWEAETYQGQWLIANLIAVVFSALSHANGTFRNYASRQDNVQALLNSKLPSENLLPFALIMQEILRRAGTNDLLLGSVGKHLERALALGDGNFVLDYEAPWSAIESLLPELFDPLLRFELETLDALPTWARPKTNAAATVITPPWDPASPIQSLEEHHGLAHHLG
ncbi:DUF6035 family protein [Caulobacter sp. NIBR2454]|uniref:DUF6035 family protein n=1 Tax=Caulobacter sp. NIBR2454 TaxID=3015996 RepID=UPI0022B6FFC9|nr:hypothetical protein [Caulobacter sp. NIBR2454]